jgi:HD superfamily phosphohydrolase
MDVHEALGEGFTAPVRDGLWGHIYLTPELEALTRTPPFMRLYRIFQLGPVFSVYPGATHTRAAHSLGVYHLCRRTLRALAREGAGRWLTAEGARSFLCAGLLHDLGHYPYAHSLKELPLKEHEELTGKAILAEPLKSLIARAGADPAFTAAIVDKRLAPGGDEGELRFYRRLLSGALDPDKLDYLNRDAQYCGVPYGAQDVDFILSRLHPHRERGADIDSRGIPGVEALLFSKYLMYRTVYWHHSVRSATAMVKKALILALERGAIGKEELYGLDDQGLFALLRDRKDKAAPLAASFRLAERVRDGSLYQPLAERPFDETAHRRLLPVMERARHEEALAAELARVLRRPVEAGDIIIDIPEAFSFETGLFVNDQNCPFAESSSAFKPALVAGLARSLRIIRVFLNPGLWETIKDAPAPAEEAAAAFLAQSGE